MKIVAAVTLAALLPALANGAEPPPLDEDFLEYLAEFEGQTDNWTWFADDAADSKDEKPATPAQRVKEVKK